MCVRSLRLAPLPCGVLTLYFDVEDDLNHAVSASGSPGRASNKHHYMVSSRDLRVTALPLRTDYASIDGADRRARSTAITTHAYRMTRAQF